ncbi:pyruvate kinase [Ruminiclostridium cellulolyticum]|uniref:Pyruvate kinase n=1 Tax=Ruminiclostridium cellulolyticum (strain ATCC 35319 / DSM 5812 / JCM 6584 / H10) TaxID=394503 RepID=B8I6Q5_RUMCH|nr:pyruvate kinase [Ruminiclostridium cellulolyticum]ACL76897.1 pyruvate kinase [Ruminiclostridium cellulolyticum H10]
MRRTKIICTLGPASDNEDILRKMMLGGMSLARMNFSHGTHEEHKKRADLVKKIREELNLPIPLLLDTKGPEIRTGKFKNDQAILKENNEFILVNEDILGDETKCTITYKELYKDVSRGSKILINDGLVELEVTEIKNKDIYCRVLNGGAVGNHKGINVPGAEIKLPSLTEQDIDDIKFGIKNDFDIIAASFVRKASDVVEIRKVLEKNGGKDILIIAKIENREGIKNFNDILKVSDGIMVARGDLGVEIPVEEVPIVQKNIIEKCYQNGKPVITATQMLDSMIRNPRPTRAEASDVANAIFDGTSCVMLSGETAAGKYPIETIEVMAKIAEKAEKSMDYWNRFATARTELDTSVTNAISHATCTTALDLKAAAIITVTQSGHTARMIARFRPACPIIATTANPKVQRQLNLSWGVMPYLVGIAKTTDDMFDNGVEKALESGLVKNGDLAVITAGMPAGISGTTNTLKVHIVGRVLVQGVGIGTSSVTGELCVAQNTKEAMDKFTDGNIIVAPFTDNSMLPVIKRASAIVVEEHGQSCHAATVGLALDIPVILGAENATKILKAGSVVTVDSERGLVIRCN